MQTVFFRLVTLVALLAILIGIFGLSYTYRVDHRTARSLSAYARIDFQSSYTGEGRLEGATLALWDYRYDSAAAGHHSLDRRQCVGDESRDQAHTAPRPRGGQSL